MDLYSEIILDYYKNPRNQGKLDNPSNSAREHNPLCGDKINVDLLIKDGIISDIKFRGEGCAISLAATSMLTEQLVNKSPKKVLKLNQEYINNLLNIPISPGRAKCAMLGLICIKKALNHA
jgi:nitrogen fixation protein NifU and related proteins